MSRTTVTRVAQVNIGKSQINLVSVYRYSLNLGVSILLIQEPPYQEHSEDYSYRNLDGFQGVHSKNCSLYFRNGLQGTVLTNSEYAIAVSVEGTVFVTTYLHAAHSISTILEELSPQIWTNKWFLGGDANASHPDWDFCPLPEYVPSETKAQRGTDLVSWLSTKNGHCCNKPTEYGSFFNRVSETYIDVTYSNLPTTDIVMWDMTEDLIATDHRYIYTDIRIKTQRTTKRAYTDWKRYREYLMEAMAGLWNLAPSEWADAIEQALTRAKCRAQYMRVVPQTQPVWWSAEVNEVWVDMQKYNNKLRKDKNNTRYHDIYKSKYKIFRYTARKAKRATFAKFLENIEWADKNDFRKFMRIFKGRHQQGVPTILRDDLGQEIPTQEAAKTLLDNAFQFQEGTNNPNIPDYLLRDLRGLHQQGHKPPPVTPMEFKHALKAIKPTTAAGYDGLGRGHFDKLDDQWVHLVVRMYNTVLEKGDIPTSWMIAKVVFLPKVGKPLDRPKNWRPISVMPLLLRILDKIVTRRLTAVTTNSNWFLECQHGFRPNRSTITLLRDLYNQVDLARDKRSLFAILAIDFTKAFDLIETSQIGTGLRTAAKEIAISPYLPFLLSYLQTRMVRSSFSGSTASKKVNRGIPQGGSLSPWLFNVGMTQCISNVRDLPGTTLFLFAVDLTVLVTATSRDLLLKRIRAFLDKLCVDLRIPSFKVNFEKTSLFLPFRKNLQWSDSGRQDGLKFFFPYQDHEIEMVHTIKLLGITFTNDLKFNTHLANTLHVARAKFLKLRRFFGANWGLTPAFRRKAVQMLLFSHFRYGAGLYMASVTQGLISKVDVFASDVAKSLLGLTRIAPSFPSQIIAYRYPLTTILVADFVKFFSLTQHNWKLGPVGSKERIRYLIKMAEIQEGLEYPFAREEVVIPYWTFRPINLMERIVFDNNIDRKSKKPLSYPSDGWDCGFFTDASKHLKTGKLGGGLLRFDRNGYIATHIYPYTEDMSVFEAEAYTIYHALQLVGHSTRILLYIDALSVIQAVMGYRTQSPFIKSIWELVQQKDLKLLLSWVPGHEGILGNETADQAAKLGASWAPSPKFVVNRRTIGKWFEVQLRDRRLSAWQNARVWDHSHYTRYVNSNRGIEWMYRFGFNKPELLRFVLNCNQLNRTVAFIDRGRTPYCYKCPGEYEDTRHVLYYCPLYRVEREQLWRKCGKPPVREHAFMDLWLLSFHLV